jgi:hypothetical protein
MNPKYVSGPRNTCSSKQFSSFLSSNLICQSVTNFNNNFHTTFSFKNIINSYPKRRSWILVFTTQFLNMRSYHRSKSSFRKLFGSYVTKNQLATTTKQQ